MKESSPIRRLIATGAVLLPLLAVEACKDTAPKEQPGITSGDVFKKAVVNEDRFFTRTRTPHVTRHEVYIADCPTKTLPTYERVTEECKTNAFVVPEKVFDEVELGQSVKAKENWTEVHSDIRR